MIPVGSSEQGLGTVFSTEDTVDGKSQIKGKVSGLSHQAVHSQITKSSPHATGRDRKQREAECGLWDPGNPCPMARWRFIAAVLEGRRAE